MKQPTCEELSNMSMIEILEIAIANEVDAYQYYKTAADCVGDEKIRDMLLTLASIEEGHKLQLEGHLTELKAHLELSNAISRRYDKQ
jgi:rubrerythrin